MTPAESRFRSLSIPFDPLLPNLQGSSDLPIQQRAVTKS